MGDVISDADILINGKYIGNILCKENTVIVTKTGVVTGTILAKKSIIYGKIYGRVESTLIEIQKNGRIEGEIYSENLSIDDGGFFIGISKKITIDLDLDLDLNKKYQNEITCKNVKNTKKMDAKNTVTLKFRIISKSTICGHVTIRNRCAS
ncbi:MAG: bactofilin family protein [Arsenophonus sp. NC-CH8-MAG3]